MATGGASGESAGAAGTGMGGAPPVIGPEVTVQLGMTRQEMVGFGINNNWSPAMTDAEADLLFGTDENQLGLVVLRIGMNPSGNAYNGADCWSDIEKASARGVEHFIGTLWSPPANMKSNNSITGGGHLLPEYYEEWSDTIAAFPSVVKQNTGVDLYAMSPQNETDFASCGFEEPCNGNYDTTIFTGAEYADFAAIVGPKLHALNPPVKMIAPEASEWIHVWSNESGCCSEPGNLGSSDPLDCGFPATNPACDDYNGYDYGHALYNHPTAWQYVDILGTHQYDTQVAEPWPDDVPDKVPVWQTEMSGVKWWPEQGPSTHIENGVAVAGWIHNALTVGEVSAWLWWWYRALGDTNEGLLLSDGTVAKRMWTFGNYSRFIRPGYTRVEVTGEIPAGVLLTAFLGPDGTVVVVAVNQGTAVADVPITIASGTAPAEMSLWVTSESDDLARKDPVTVTGGIFMASLPGTSVTTFVGN
jgi:O-glycosyl hydrolase